MTDWWMVALTARRQPTAGQFFFGTGCWKDSKREEFAGVPPVDRDAARKLLGA